MRHCKTFTLPACRLAALVVLLTASGGVGKSRNRRQRQPNQQSRPMRQLRQPLPTKTAEEDIRDIRPPIHIPYSWLWAVYVAGGLGLAGLAFAAWRWQRWRRQSRRNLLYEVTLEKLEAARALMQPGKGYRFSIVVSEIVRKYIEQAFQVRAAHRTTEEFLHDLVTQSHGALSAHQPLLAKFLEHCDLAKSRALATLRSADGSHAPQRRHVCP